MTDRERDALEALARRVLGDQQSLALPLCILGHAAVRRGDLRGAKRLFRRAAEVDPALVDALQGLQTVERRLSRSDITRH
jgi:Flp pilus assembly protein TadD